MMMSHTTECQKSVNAPSTSSTFSCDLICSFVCVHSQPATLEHGALHEAVAFPSCGCWSVGMHCSHRRLLCLTSSLLFFFPQNVWIGMARFVFSPSVWRSDPQLEASWCSRSFTRFHEWGFLVCLGLHVSRSGKKLFCKQVLFPAHLLSGRVFSKASRLVLAVWLCVWGGVGVFALAPLCALSCP